MKKIVSYFANTPMLKLLMTSATKNTCMTSKKLIAALLCLSLATGQASAFKMPTWKNSKGLIAIVGLSVAANLIYTIFSYRSSKHEIKINDPQDQVAKNKKMNKDLKIDLAINASLFFGLGVILPCIFQNKLTKAISFSYSFNSLRYIYTAFYNQKNKKPQKQNAIDNYPIDNDPIFDACKNGDYRLLWYILTNGSHETSKDCKFPAGKYPLDYIRIYYNEDDQKESLKKRINAIDSKGHSPLYYAAAQTNDTSPGDTHTTIGVLVSENGATIRPEDIKEAKYEGDKKFLIAMYLSAAIDNNDENAVKTAIEFDAEITKSHQKQLVNKKEEIKNLIGNDILLSFAIEDNNEDSVETLIANGVIVNKIHLEKARLKNNISKILESKYYTQQEQKQNEMDAKNNKRKKLK